MGYNTTTFKKLHPVDKLIYATIKQAQRDANSQRIAKATRQEARAFLRDCGLSKLVNG